ncbi:HesB/IscA family protein [Leptolyngbya sp. KIOST-1]|uniref:HesB/IscA family protein n=1 Tax=Leptolyngbya sp. KIOST-1 TaxID=1229172 RepID=UPI000907BC2B|nr:iron-sulfur cluster assembly accessory protein [Leptolyngbya sp. KIOST-1]
MIHIRPAAAQEIKRLLARSADRSADSPSLVRLALEPGGCAEWTYRLMAEADLSDLSESALQETNDATVVRCDDISLVVSPEALELVEDLTIDYAEDLMGGGFRFTNPLAQRTCGCGNAFSLTTDAPVSEDCTGGLPTG